MTTKTDIKSVEESSIEDMVNSDNFYQSEYERKLIEDEKFIDDERLEEMEEHFFTLRDQIGKNYVKIGGILHKIQKNGAFIDLGYSTFTAYVEKGLNFGERKAHYLKNIWKQIRVDLNLEPDQINKVEWSKTKEIARVKDKDDRKELLNEAIENKEDNDKDDFTVEDVKQKVEETNSDGDVDVKQTKKMYFNLYPEQRETINSAIKQASSEADSEKRNHLLEMICMHYLASSYGNQELNFLIDRIEDIFDCEIVAVDPDTGEILHGDVEANDE